MTTPADELRAAAARLRTLAAAATSGPWAAEKSNAYGHRVGNSDEADWIAWTGEHGETRSEADAQFIAAMHPGVGEELAKWLEHEAAGHAAVESLGDIAAELLNVQLERVGHTAQITHSTLPQALAVARAINTGSQP